ncbi:MAG: diadenosine tetraphosphatase [Legionellales bacterium]|nr:diadenosine tetraphosphatase [Legionellales bacterium]
MSTYIIGDLQGCFEPLERLLSKIVFSPRNDRLIFCGDIVNRGPASEACLDFVWKHADCAQIVLGNHDLALLCIAYGYAKGEPSDTMGSILSHPKAEQWLDWLRIQPLVFYDALASFIVTHAGIWPLWNLSDCLKANDFMKQALSGPHWKNVLANLYGDGPTMDSPALNETDRCRFIVNALTRMRYCDAQGGLVLDCKASPEHAPSTIFPWYAHPSRTNIKPMILFGHWASLNGACETPNIEALDTGCVWGGALTAYCIEDGRRISVPANPKDVGISK